ncbi:MAG: rhomboid family intramembrane serine protease [Ferruginibacter sp.]
MPQHEQPVALQNTDPETALANAYQAMQQLDWTILFAMENALVATTPKNWKTRGQQIVCTVADDLLIIKSVMVNNEAADITGINKKNIAAFISAFEASRNAADATAIDNNKAAIATLRADTVKAAAAEEEEATEVDRAMNLTGSNLYVTYAIMAINVLVFVLMAINGAGIFEANGYVHIKWGSNFSPLTLSGDWWRLITSTFIHFGIIHLAMNMYCLYTVGVYLEPMLGKARYITAYLCTGLLASLISLWWHTDTVNSAGASGAVFGLYGLFFALLVSNLIPKAVRMALLKSIGIFIVFNLAYGMKSGVDNAAHVGGLVSGFIIGLGYLFAIKKEKEQQKVQWVLPLVIVISIAATFTYLEQNKLAPKERAEMLHALEAAAYEDNDRFVGKLTKFDELNQLADSAVNDNSISNEEQLKRIDEIGLPKMAEATVVINSTKKMNISPTSHKKAGLLLEYIELRKAEMELMRQLIETKEEEKITPQLNTNRAKADALFQELLKL